MSTPRLGWAEQDADAVWWHDVVTICRALLSHHASDQEAPGGPTISGSDIAGVATVAYLTEHYPSGTPTLVVGSPALAAAVTAAGFTADGSPN